MRVALVFQGCHRRGGVERIMWEAARHLRAEHEVMVVCRVAEELPDDVRHLPVPESRLSGPLAGLGFRLRAAPVVAAAGADITVSYGAQCPPADVYVVNSVHRSWLGQAGPVHVRGRALPGAVRRAAPRNLVSLALERDYYRHARGGWLVPCADQVTRDLTRLYGLGGAPATVVHNGFSPDEFSPDRRQARRAPSRADLGYGDDEIVLLMAANEWRRKGLPVVLDAMDRLGDPRLRLLLVGRTSPEPFLERLPAERRRRVRYLGSSEDVALQHAAADLFVMPTQYEAFSLAIIEALASGLPVITTTAPGAGDAVRPGVNGLLLEDPLDAAGLADLLARAADPGARRAWSDAASGTVEDYRWDRLMATFAAILVEAHARKTGR